jgi:glutamate dehydrogenase
MGMVFAMRAKEDTGAEPSAIARAYTIAREVFSVRGIWSQIEALDTRVPAAVQYAALLHTNRLLGHASYWLLEHHRGSLDIERAVRRFKVKVGALLQGLRGVAGVTEQARIAAERSRLVAAGVPDGLAVAIASLDTLHCALDLAEVATAANMRILDAARVYFDLGERIGLVWIKGQIESLAADGHWQSVARRSLRDTAFSLHRRITAAVLATSGGRPQARVDAWMAAHAANIDRLERLVVDLRTGAATDFAALSVALDSARRLVEA